MLKVGQKHSHGKILDDSEMRFTNKKETRQALKMNN